MSHRRSSRHRLELEDLPADVATALEAAVAGKDVALTRAGEPIGTLGFRSSTLEGAVLADPARPRGASPVPDGVTVVATAMELTDSVRRRLSDELGESYLVLDLHEAPPSSDVLLTPPISPQLVGALRQQFPRARVLITEIEDEELGVHYAGPVSRMLEAGASGYLPPRPITELATTVHSYLTTSNRPALERAEPVVDQIEPDQGRRLLD